VIRDVSLLQNAQTGSGPHPVPYSVRTGSCFPGLKRAERAADLSPPSSVEVNNKWSYTSISHVFVLVIADVVLFITITTQLQCVHRTILPLPLILTKTPRGVRCLHAPLPPANKHSYTGLQNYKLATKEQDFYGKEITGTNCPSAPLTTTQRIHMGGVEV
jgi:hypothetical protein